ncbi:MAG TPA: DNA polymerase IV [Bacteroidales bacterium]|nr:DNA polymerase IV [Bacteroidales bacterium]HNR42370.1 DNA polymerase IV [Bacteroidales bacterium]HPM18798.1 DNA polymerase IV [Bacteroidales bacterium]HPV15881.1 DNA polymerase IV [Bacteroidales bacterium]HQG78096.1 DNA polymerase IV [Bacteroidales bacterium]
MRKIIHIDMDAFFASIEQLDNPGLRGKPVAVGGSGERHVVAAASYEARKFGVRSAMPSLTARRLCPDLIFVPHRFDRYEEISAIIFGIFREYTDRVEPLSIDEAFLDVTHDRKGIGSATLIARAVKQEIEKKTGLTASAGISYNKFLAKIASDIRKPNGLFVISPDDAMKFIDELPVEKFFGIGRVTAEKMHRLGIHKGSELKQMDLLSLIRNFGKAGRFYHDIVRGIDNRPVEAFTERKSIGTEVTYEKDLTSQFGIIAELYRVEKELMVRLENAGTTGRTVTVKVKFSDFRQITRSRTLPCYIRDFDTLHREVTAIRKSMDLEGSRIRLLGVTVSNLESDDHADRQLLLFDENVIS